MKLDVREMNGPVRDVMRGGRGKGSGIWGPLWAVSAVGLAGVSVQASWHDAAARLPKQARASDAAAPGQAMEYTVTDVGALDGGGNYHGGGLNDRGQVVGVQRNTVFLWDADTMRRLGQGFATAINERGQVAGGTDGQASLWRQGQRLPLGTLPGFTASQATAINDRGQVAGRAYGRGAVQSDSLNAVNRAFLWDGRKLSDLGVPPRCVGSRAYGLNGQGQVVGWAMGRDGRSHACLWDHGRALDLGRRCGATFSLATAVNDLGQAVGSAGDSPTDIHAVLWEPSRPPAGSPPAPWTLGRTVDLGKPPGTTSAKATAINGRGQAVGTALAGVDSVPFVWDRARGLRDLNTAIPPGSGWLLTSAYAVNKRGQILGLGYHRDPTNHIENEKRLFVLTPVPRPAPNAPAAGTGPAAPAWDDAQLLSNPDFGSTGIRLDGPAEGGGGPGAQAASGTLAEGWQDLSGTGAQVRYERERDGGPTGGRCQQMEVRGGPARLSQRVHLRAGRYRASVWVRAARPGAVRLLVQTPEALASRDPAADLATAETAAADWRANRLYFSRTVPVSSGWTEVSASGTVPASGPVDFTVEADRPATLWLAAARLEQARPRPLLSDRGTARLALAGSALCGLALWLGRRGRRLGAARKEEPAL